MNSIHIVQAAFRSKDGTIYKTGVVHNIEEVPEGLEVEDGFVDSDGKFMTREEATEKLHASHPVQSEEIQMELEKREGEAYSISEPAPIDHNTLETSIYHNGKKIGHLSFNSQANMGGTHKGYHSIAGADISALHRKKGLYGKALQSAAKYVKSRLGSKGLVSEGHLRSEAATGAWIKLAHKNKTVKKTPGLDEDAPDFRLSEATLEKMMPTPTFPKLGMSDDRRETPLVSKQGAALKDKLMLQSIKRRKPNSSLARMNSTDSKEEPRRIGRTLTAPGIDHTLSYATNSRAKLHEDLHLMFNRVRNKYGKSAAINLATNLYNHIPQESKQDLNSFVSFKYGGKSPHPTQWHEEHLAHLIDYLNSSKSRDRFHKDQPGHVSPITGQLTDKGREFQTNLKRAYQAIRQAGEKANPAWTQRVLKSNRLTKAEAYTDSSDYLSISINNFNLEELEKNDLDVAVIPRIVKAFHPEAQETAIEVRHAFSTLSVRPIILNGKHCKGTALAFDNVSNHTWLLKPGSGADSPAAGVREESASQSRREVAFSKIAHMLGLGEYVPYGDLLLLDGNEAACMEFLNPTFISFKKVKADKEYNLKYLFSKYLDTGVLYQWAALDYILGQTDRHAGNMMVNRDGLVKLIDAGSAFAGNSYNPAVDPKSFVPFYLRVFLSDKFSRIPPQQRFSEYPKLHRVAEDSLDEWIGQIDPIALVTILKRYGLNPNPVLSRLHKLQSYVGRKSAYLNLFFSGVNNEYRQESTGPI